MCKFLKNFIDSIHFFLFESSESKKFEFKIEKNLNFWKNLESEGKILDYLWIVCFCLCFLSLVVMIMYVYNENSCVVWCKNCASAATTRKQQHTNGAHTHTENGIVSTTDPLSVFFSRFSLIDSRFTRNQKKILEVCENSNLIKHTTKERERWLTV